MGVMPHFSHHSKYFAQTSSRLYLAARLRKQEEDAAMTNRAAEQEAAVKLKQERRTRGDQTRLERRAMPPLERLRLCARYHLQFINGHDR
jgi:hypothetical protein